MFEMHNVGTVPAFKMHNVVTVPTLKIHNVGTVPNNMHNIGTKLSNVTIGTTIKSISINPITAGVSDQRLLPGGVFRTPKLFSANLILFLDL